MIKPEELRIGNTIETRLGGGEWRPCNVDLKDLSFIDMPDQKVYRPIPLTEEWLVKFGFVYNSFSLLYELNYSFYGEYCNDGFYVTLNNVEYEYLFVHKLQNLYFALSGMELTIKK